MSVNTKLTKSLFSTQALTHTGEDLSASVFQLKIKKEKMGEKQNDRTIKGGKI